MFKFTKCDFCPVEQHYNNNYGTTFYRSETVRGISPLDCEFLLNNLVHYAIKRSSPNSGYDKKHCGEQIRKIYYIFSKFGIPEEMVKDAVPIINRKKLLRIICEVSEKHVNANAGSLL